ncbi:hypothetical protein Tco_1198056, partial [Tanacetum coccineum]
MYHSRFPHKKDPAVAMLNGASYLSLLLCSSLTLNIHKLCDAFFPANILTNEHILSFFADGEYLTGAIDSLVDLRTYEVSDPPSSKNAPSSESSLSDLPLSSKLPLFLDPSLVSELPPGL